MAFRWSADDGPELHVGLVVLRISGDPGSIAKKPYIFVIFQGVRIPVPLSGSAHIGPRPFYVYKGNIVRDMSKMCFVKNVSGCYLDKQK